MLWILYSQHIYVHEPLHFQTLWVHYNMLGLGHCYVFKSKTCCETETTNTKVISTSKWSETIFVSVNIELKSFNLLFKLRVLMYTYSCRNNLREIYILIKASLLSFLIPPNFVNLWSFSFWWEWHYWKYNFFIRGFDLGLYSLCPSVWVASPTLTKSESNEDNTYKRQDIFTQYLKILSENVISIFYLWSYFAHAMHY